MRFGYQDFLTADAARLIDGQYEDRPGLRAVLVRLTDTCGNPGCSNVAWSVERAP